jgi:hypothetical protein
MNPSKIKPEPKLTNSQIEELRRRYINGEQKNKLAEEFKISRQTLHYHAVQIKKKDPNYKTWEELRTLRLKPVDYTTEKPPEKAKHQNGSEEIIIENRPQRRLTQKEKEEQERYQGYITRIDSKLNDMFEDPSAKPVHILTLIKARNELDDKINSKDEVFIIPPPREFPV